MSSRPTKTFPEKPSPTTTTNADLDKFVQPWLDAGYKKYEAPTFRNSPFLLSRKFADETGVRYHLHVYPYVYDEYMSLEGDAQFNRDGQTISILYLNAKSPELYEKMMAEIWEKMGFDYYRRYDET